MTFTLPWWSMPLICTIVFFAIAWAKCDSKRQGDYDFFTPLWDIGKFTIALIASLVAWLIYFIIV